MSNPVKDIAVATSVKLAISSISFNQATNAQIVGELIMQRDILQAKLVKTKTQVICSPTFLT